MIVINGRVEDTQGRKRGRETRKKREWYEGASYHIMGRGNRHGVIYRDRDDYGLFLRLLKEVQNRYPFVLQAYCLMTNHFHLELTTKNDPIWKIMQHIEVAALRVSLL